MKQKSLSARQQCWLDLLSDFDFEIQYIPGESNVVADTLSRMYENDPASLIRASSEYVETATVSVITINETTVATTGLHP